MTTREAVLARYEADLSHTINGLYGEHRPLSNFHIEPFEWNGVQWAHSEGAYQSAKVSDIGTEERQKIAAMTPTEVKRWGRTCVIRSDWDAVKVDIMRSVLNAKFAFCPVAIEVLRSTGNRNIVELNWWKDSFWGVDYHRGGQNHLGQILMQIRDTL